MLAGRAKVSTSSWLCRKYTHVLCAAFTPFQSTKIGELVDGTYEDAHDGDDMVEDDGSSNAPTYMSPDSSVSQSSSATDQDKHAALAREFGLDAQLVQALAERLGMANRS